MKKIIVIVDDNQVFTYLLRDYLKKQGYLVEVFANGLDAFSFMRYHASDLLITDLQMPEMDGESLVLMVRKEISCSLPIIVISSCLSFQLRDRIMDKINFFLEKPFLFSELNRCLNLLLIPEMNAPGKRNNISKKK